MESRNRGSERQRVERIHRRIDRGFDVAGFTVGVIATLAILGPGAALGAAAVSVVLIWKRW
jgi:hypothetical protein